MEDVLVARCHRSNSHPDFLPETFPKRVRKENERISDLKESCRMKMTVCTVVRKSSPCSER
jgi:hypothetical protein